MNQGTPPPVLVHGGQHVQWPGIHGGAHHGSPPSTGGGGGGGGGGLQFGSTSHGTSQRGGPPTAHGGQHAQPTCTSPGRHCPAPASLDGGGGGAPPPSLVQWGSMKHATSVHGGLPALHAGQHSQPLRSAGAGHQTVLLCSSC